IRVGEVMVHADIEFGFIQLANRNIGKVVAGVTRYVGLWIQLHHGLANWINQAGGDLVTRGYLWLESICRSGQRVAAWIALEIDIGINAGIRGRSDHVRICDYRPETGLPNGSAEKSPLRMASEGT